jgi:aryl-alcohol dehydrogenase-like predicted oxidoreductase
VRAELASLDQSGVLRKPISQMAMQYLLYFDEVSAIIPGINKFPHLHSAIDLLSMPHQEAGLVATLDPLLPDCYPGYR